MGYFLGTVEVVAHHLELMVLVIAVLSTLPVAVTVLRSALRSR